MADYTPISSFNAPASRNLNILPSGAAITTTGNGTYSPISRTTPDNFTEFESYHIPDWDGDGAQPIARDTVEAARRFNQWLPRRLSPADVAPGADGTIGFEWRYGTDGARTFIIVEIGPGDIVKARRISDSGVKSRFAPISSGNGDAVENLLSMLFSRRDVPSE